MYSFSVIVYDNVRIFLSKFPFSPLRLPDKNLLVPSMASSLLLTAMAYTNGEDVCV